MTDKGNDKGQSQFGNEFFWFSVQDDYANDPGNDFGKMIHVKSLCEGDCLGKQYAHHRAGNEDCGNAFSLCVPADICRENGQERYAHPDHHVCFRQEPEDIMTIQIISGQHADKEHKGVD